MGKIKDRFALIAGVSNNVGEAITLRLAHFVAKIAVCDSDTEKMGKLISKVSDTGGDAISVNTNLTDPDNVRTAIKNIFKQFGRIDILVNNSNKPEGKSITELSVAEFNEAVNTCLNSQFYFLRDIIPIMQQNEGGRVINISNLEFLGLPGRANLSASEAGIFGLTRSLALEVAKDNITVNNVVKGDIENGSDSEEEVASRAMSIPVKMLGKPIDVARAVGFFADDSSKYITGQTFFVCGGKSLHFSMSV